MYGLSEADLSTQILGGSNINNSGYASATPQPWSLVPEAQRSNYFYVVPLGYYENGQLKMLESTSYGNSFFWSSTAYSYSSPGHYRNKDYAFYFRIYVDNPYSNNSSASIYMEGDYDNENLRTKGYQTWPGEQFTYN